MFAETSSETRDDGMRVGWLSDLPRPEYDIFNPPPNRVFKRRSARRIAPAEARIGRAGESTAPARGSATHMEALTAGTLAAFPEGTAERANVPREDAEMVLRAAARGLRLTVISQMTLQRLLQAAEDVGADQQRREAIRTGFLHKFLQMTGGEDVDPHHKCSMDCRPFERLAEDMYGCQRSGFVHECSTEACMRVSIPYKGTTGSFCLFSEKQCTINVCTETRPRRKAAQPHEGFGDMVGARDEEDAPDFDAMDEGRDADDDGGLVVVSESVEAEGVDLAPHTGSRSPPERPLSPSVIGGMQSMSLRTSGGRESPNGFKRARVVPLPGSPRGAGRPLTGMVYNRSFLEAGAGVSMAAASTKFAQPPPSPGWGSVAAAPPKQRYSPRPAGAGDDPLLLSPRLSAASPLFAGVSPLDMRAGGSPGWGRGWAGGSPRMPRTSSSPSITMGGSGGVGYRHGDVLPQDDGGAQALGSSSPLIRNSGKTPLPARPRNGKTNAVRARATSGLALSSSGPSSDHGEMGLERLRDESKRDAGLEPERLALLANALLDAVLWNAAARVTIHRKHEMYLRQCGRDAVDAACREASLSTVPRELTEDDKEKCFRGAIGKQEPNVALGDTQDEEAMPARRQQLLSVFRRAWRVYCASTPVFDTSNSVDSHFLTFCFGCLYRMGTHQSAVPLVGVQNFDYLPHLPWLRDKLMSLAMLVMYMGDISIQPTITGMIQPPRGLLTSTKSKNRAGRRCAQDRSRAWRLLHTKSLKMVNNGAANFHRIFGHDAPHALQLLELIDAPSAAPAAASDDDEMKES